jgi:hypothetical protein
MTPKSLQTVTREQTAIPPTGDEESQRVAHTELTGHKQAEAGNPMRLDLYGFAPIGSSVPARGKSVDRAWTRRTGA